MGIKDKLIIFHKLKNNIFNYLFDFWILKYLIKKNENFVNKLDIENFQKNLE